MKRFLTLCCFLSAISHSGAQFSVQYNPALQPENNMQYFTPSGNLFVGDCIPFFHNNTYYLYWLVDSAHHRALNGLGGHQWVLSTSKDLKKWKHYPVVLGIDEEWEKSICTGSVVYTNNKFYAYYATRLINNEGKVNERLSYAVSNDGITFKKQKPNPFYMSAPGYSEKDFRDPKVIVDSSGVFHLFVSSKKNNSLMQVADGALVHLTSKDLKKWEVKEPLLTGQQSVPECPDHFYWNGWYYLVYGHSGNTFYVKSRNPYGPWQEPQYQTLNEDWSNVAKTAEFANGRRIAAAWIPSRRDNKDNEREIFGGSAVFREVVQHEDGTLGTKFPSEMIPATSASLPLKLIHDSMTTTPDPENYLISAPNGVGAGYFENIPVNCRITLEIEPLGNNEEYGLYVRSNVKATGGYKLNFSSNNRTVTLANTSIYAVDGLNNNINIDIIMKNDIIDVCIDNRRCIVNRLPEQKGSMLWLFAKHGYVKFKSIKISPLLEN
ncbi:MAG: family 43 glycosylhydrolase [Chitinophagaceae bacterium]